MRKVTTFLGLALLALAGSARAQEAAAPGADPGALPAGDAMAPAPGAEAMPAPATGYPDEYCRAAEILEDRLLKCGAELAAPTLKIDGDPSDQRHTIQDWVKSLS